MKLVNLTENDSDDLIKVDALGFGKNYDLPPLTKDQIKGVLANGFILGIKKGTELVSDIQIKKEKNGWYIYSVCTVPDEQHHGFASQLLRKVLELAKASRVKRITATVKPGNVGSIKLFMKLGFRETKFLPNHYGKGKDRLLFERTNI